VAAACGLVRLSRQLLQQSANPNIQTSAPYSDGISVYKQTPLHLAVFYKHVDVINAFLAFKCKFLLQESPSFCLIEGGGPTSGVM
jgi:ankyrin repeat protein